MLKRLIPVLSLLAAVVLLVMLNFTTPAGIGPFGVLIFFAAVYVLMFGLASLLVVIFTCITEHQVGKRTYFYSAVLAFGPIMLLLAQSLESMSLWTVGLMVMFEILACFLVSKRL